MKTHKITTALLIASLAMMPATQASAHEWYHGRGGGWHGGHGGGPILGLFAAAGAVVGAAAVIATAPVRILADAASGPAEPVYQSQPVYQQPVYQQPVAYAPPPPVAYPAYGYPQPVAYGYAPAYYYGHHRGYYAYAE